MAPERRRRTRSTTCRRPAARRVRASETQPCVFCHTPHNAKPARAAVEPASGAPTYSHLWEQHVRRRVSRRAPSTRCRVSAAGQPTGSSQAVPELPRRHDRAGRHVEQRNHRHEQRGRLRARLGEPRHRSLERPPSVVLAQPGEFPGRDPPPADAVALETRHVLTSSACRATTRTANGRRRGRAKFLVKSNARSAVCTTCHAEAAAGWTWASSPHATSAKTYTAANTGGVAGLGAHTGYATVADNACESVSPIALGPPGPAAPEGRQPARPLLPVPRQRPGRRRRTWRPSSRRRIGTRSSRRTVSHRPRLRPRRRSRRRTSRARGVTWSAATATTPTRAAGPACTRPGIERHRRERACWRASPASSRPA